VSQENVEIVRSIFELALRKRDLDAALPLFAEDALVDWSDSRAPYSGVYRGVAAIRRAFEGWQDAWDEWETKIVGSTEVDAETVVVAPTSPPVGAAAGSPSGPAAPGCG
jgi:ketosteroid isomerase-like protein